MTAASTAIDVARVELLAGGDTAEACTVAEASLNGAFRDDPAWAKSRAETEKDGKVTSDARITASMPLKPWSKKRRAAVKVEPSVVRVMKMRLSYTPSSSARTAPRTESSAARIATAE